MPGLIPLNTMPSAAMMAGAGTRQNDKMADAARDFEAVYLAEMIKPMLETVPVNDEFGGGNGEDIFRGVLADEYGKLMARSGGIGLASPVQAAMIAAQEAANGHATQRGGVQ